MPDPPLSSSGIGASVCEIKRFLHLVHGFQAHLTPASRTVLELKMSLSGETGQLNE
ncbi:MAG: hypothetical protein ACJAZN_000075 [Planctomycetota bacterium]|jgi:hypothetical protein